MEFLKPVATPCGWGLPSLVNDQPFFGVEICLGGVASRWAWAGLTKKVCQHPSTETGH